MYKVYRIANLVNHKVYIGVTKKNLTQRLREHIRESKRGRCSGRKLYKEINKIGAENFYIEKLLLCDDKEEGYFFERMLIKRYNTVTDGLNESLGGAGKSFVYHEDIIKKFEECKCLKRTAATLGCCVDTVAAVIKANGYNTYTATELLGKRVRGRDTKTGEIVEFLSCGKAGEYCAKIGRCKRYSSGTRQKILLACNGKLHKAYGFEWNFC